MTNNSWSNLNLNIKLRKRITYGLIRNIRKKKKLLAILHIHRDSTLLKTILESETYLIVYECAVRTAWNNDHYAVNALCKLPQLARSKIIYAAYVELWDERKRILSSI